MVDQKSAADSSAAVCLASASPVRAQLLRSAGLVFDVEPANIDEARVKAEAGKNCEGAKIAPLLAAMKAVEISRRRPSEWVIGADQILYCDGHLFDKPDDMKAARETLRALRGRPHTLTAAVCVARSGDPVWRHQSEAVLHVRPFSDRFLESYLDQAGRSILSSVGAYRLEGVGAQLFSAIDGDYFTVLGLPLIPVLDFFRQEAVLAS